MATQPYRRVRGKPAGQAVPRHVPSAGVPDLVTS